MLLSLDDETVRRFSDNDSGMRQVFTRAHLFASGALRPGEVVFGNWCAADRFCVLDFRSAYDCLNLMCVLRLCSGVVWPGCAFLLHPPVQEITHVSFIA